MSTAPPTIDDFIELLRRTTPPEYHLPIIDDPRGTIALYRAFGRAFSVLSQRTNAGAQAAFFLPSSLQTNDPASSGVRASFTATVRRTRDLDQLRTVVAGRMEIEGPQGRRYRNVDTTTWVPFDEQPSKTMRFEAVAVGHVYNLDHIADDDGMISRPWATDEPWLEKINLRALSRDRTGINASIEQSASLDFPSAVYDSGSRERFSEADIGLYLRIDYATQANNMNRVLRIVGYEDPGIEDPPDSGLRPKVLLVDDGPQRFRLTSAQADDGGVLTDETDAANDSVAGDMTLLPAAPALNDAYYFGAQVPFRELTVDLSQVGDGTWDVVWEYWNGASWTTIPGVEDGTDSFRQSGTVSWLIPGGWAPTGVNGVGAYYVRGRMDSALPILVTQPLGRTAYVGIQLQLADEDDTVTWSIVDFLDLGFELAAIGAPVGGKDATLKILGEERGLYQQPGESDDAFRQRASRLPDMVSPNAINRIVNRILGEYGYWGRARDLGGPPSRRRPPFRGVFYDVPPTSAPEFVSAYDLYGPGDLFPENDTMLQLSVEEARWHFFVEVPRLILGDWGPFYDQSFSVGLPDGGYINAAFDHAFYDGYPVTAYQIYARIHNAVDVTRMGGVGFTLLYGDLDDCP